MLEGGGRFAHGLFKHMMDAVALLIQHQKSKLVLTVENDVPNTSSDLSLRGCQWEESDLIGCIVHPLLLPLGMGVQVHAVPRRDRTSVGACPCS